MDLNCQMQLDNFDFMEMRGIIMIIMVGSNATLWGVAELPDLL